MEKITGLVVVFATVSAVIAVPVILRMHHTLTQKNYPFLTDRNVVEFPIC